MGKAYEANCWVDYEKLYYDGWWSPISYESGLNSNWDTAGKQGANDILYDFTQLNNGNLVFVGNNGNSTVGGVWVVVTDSTGKKNYWEKQFCRPYLTADGRALDPYSVCATPDSGFTVVGLYSCSDANGGQNAFAMHFVSASGTSVIAKEHPVSKSVSGFNTRICGSHLIIETKASEKINNAETSLFDISGKCVLTQKNNKAVVDISRISSGTYIVRMKTENCVRMGKVVIRN